MNPTIDFTPVLAVEQVTTLSPESIIMLLFGCAVLYGGFFWCTRTTHTLFRRWPAP